MIYFLDLDGIFNIDWSGTWDSKSIEVFNTMTKIFEAKAVVSSTWRNQYNIDQLQDIFDKQKVEIEIIDYTPTISQADRGEEITKWLSDNDYKGTYLIIDDKISGIVGYFDKDLYIIECDDSIGLTNGLAIESANKIIKQESNK